MAKIAPPSTTNRVWLRIPPILVGLGVRQMTTQARQLSHSFAAHGRASAPRASDYCRVEPTIGCALTEAFPPVDAMMSNGRCGCWLLGEVEIGVRGRECRGAVSNELSMFDWRRQTKHVYTDCCVFDGAQTARLHAITATTFFVWVILHVLQYS